MIVFVIKHNKSTLAMDLSSSDNTNACDPDVCSANGIQWNNLHVLMAIPLKWNTQSAEQNSGQTFENSDLL